MFFHLNMKTYNSYSIDSFYIAPITKLQFGSVLTDPAVRFWLHLASLAIKDGEKQINGSVQT